MKNLHSCLKDSPHTILEPCCNSRILPHMKVCLLASRTSSDTILKTLLTCKFCFLSQGPVQTPFLELISRSKQFGRLATRTSPNTIFETHLKDSHRKKFAFLPQGPVQTLFRTYLKNSHFASCLKDQFRHLSWTHLKKVLPGSGVRANPTPTPEPGVRIGLV